MAHKPFWRWRRSPWPWATVIGGIIVLLVAIRIALPYVLKDYANKILNRGGEYSGHIGDVTVHLWRGAYQIHGIDIKKKTANVDIPFFSVKVLDLSLQWDELFHGKFVSEIQMYNPHLNFVQGPTKQQSQAGTEENWGDMLSKLVPFKINSLIVNDGQVHFRNPYSDPPVDIYVDQLTALATNFTNARNLKQQLPAGVHATGRTMGKGQFDFLAHVNPIAAAPTFEMSGQLTNVDLVQLNPFMKAYGKFTIAKGGMAMFTSFAAKDGKYDGYVKVLFTNLKVFSLDKEIASRDPLEAFWDMIVGAVKTVFKNQPHDQLATTIPITGAFKKTDIHIWPTIQTLLQNAFVRALAPKANQPVTLKNAEQVKAPGQ
ncbi:MAG TPA: DUF748 domain-containing protein [Verrucomicrobiae bacterium]|nr:DUF748 domain-containing protein [Verrucomicrobiae bacterium]